MFRKFFDIDAFFGSDFSNLKKNNFERIEFNTTYYNMYSFFFIYFCYLFVKFNVKIIVRKYNNCYFNIYSV